MNLAPDEARSLASVNASFERDPARWISSYRNHSATALRRRALAAGNGASAGHNKYTTPTMRQR